MRIILAVIGGFLLALLVQPRSSPAVIWSNCAGTGATICQGMLIPGLTTINTGSQQLPTCGANTQGLRAFVTDATNAVSYHAAPGAGGSTVSWAVLCDGTSWLYD